MVKLLYFGRIAERAGAREESVTLPESVKTGAQLVDWLAERDPVLGEVLRDPSTRIALDKEIAPNEAALSDVVEIAFLPPMSGG